RRRRHKRRKARDVEHSESRSDASGTQSSHRGKVQFSDRSRSSSGSVGVNTRRSGDSDHGSSSSSGGPERATINDVTASADLLEMRESPSGGSSAVRRTPPTLDHHDSSAHDLLQLGDPGYTDTQKDTASVSLVASGPLIGGMDSFNEEPVSFDPLAPSSANSVGTGSVHTIGGKESCLATGCVQATSCSELAGLYSVSARILTRFWRLAGAKRCEFSSGVNQ
ncbi:hypothetical protein FOZ63_008955, partial [Perkinsus olseni]